MRSNWWGWGWRERMRMGGKQKGRLTCEWMVLWKGDFDPFFKYTFYPYRVFRISDKWTNLLSFEKTKDEDAAADHDTEWMAVMKVVSLIDFNELRKRVNDFLTGEENVVGMNGMEKIRWHWMSSQHIFKFKGFRWYLIEAIESVTWLPYRPQSWPLGEIKIKSYPSLASPSLSLSLSFLIIILISITISHISLSPSSYYYHFTLFVMIFSSHVHPFFSLSFHLYIPQRRVWLSSSTHNERWERGEGGSRVRDYKILFSPSIHKDRNLSTLDSLYFCSYFQLLQLIFPSGHYSQDCSSKLKSPWRHRVSSFLFYSPSYSWYHLLPKPKHWKDYWMSSEKARD